MLDQNYTRHGPKTSQIEQVAEMEFKLRAAMIDRYFRRWK
jgi:hypothetical protein